jgi:hypothetical protein
LVSAIRESIRRVRTRRGFRIRAGSPLNLLAAPTGRHADLIHRDPGEFTAARPGGTQARPANQECGAVGSRTSRSACGTISWPPSNRSSR